jgi:hypothetical protein
MSADVVRLSDRSALAQAQPDLGGDAWYVYQRAAGRRRGAFIGPFDGPDAAVAHLRDTVELELLLLDGQVRTSSTSRITRRRAGNPR